MSDPNWDEMDDAETPPYMSDLNPEDYEEEPDFVREPCYYDDNDGDQEYRAYMYGSGRY